MKFFDGFSAITSDILTRSFCFFLYFCIFYTCKMKIPDDEKDDDHEEDYTVLPESTHTLLHTEKIASVPFVYAVFIAGLSMLCLLLVLLNEMSKGDEGNWLSVPGGVSNAVRVAQYCGEFINLFSWSFFLILDRFHVIEFWIKHNARMFFGGRLNFFQKWLSFWLIINEDSCMRFLFCYTQYSARLYFFDLRFTNTSIHLNYTIFYIIFLSGIFVGECIIDDIISRVISVEILHCNDLCFSMHMNDLLLPLYMNVCNVFFCNCQGLLMEAEIAQGKWHLIRAYYIKWLLCETQVIVD